MADQWYYTNKGKETGPVSGDDLRNMAATGALRPTDMVWNQDMPNWARASTISSLIFEAGGISAGKIAFKSDAQEKQRTDPRPTRDKRRYRDDDEEDDRPRRRRPRQPAAMPTGVLIGLIAGGVVVLVVVVVGLVWVFSRGNARRQAVAVIAAQPPGAANAPGNLVMTYTVDLQVQGADIRPIVLVAQRRYTFRLKAANQAGDMDLFVSNHLGQNLAQDIGPAADAFIDFTAPYSGMFRIGTSNAGLMQNQATITVTDRGVNPNPPIQVIPNPQFPRFPNGPGNVGIEPNRPHGKLALGIKGDVFAFLQTAVKENRLADIDVKGFPFGDSYREVLPEGGLLIGFEVGYGKFVNNQTVKALRPIYLTKNGERMGLWHGPVPANPTTFKAKAGYVVGGLTIKSSIHLDGFSIKFMKLGQGNIVTQDQYDSPWIGGQGGSPPTAIGGQGYFFVGVAGKISNQNVACALGLVAVLEQK